MTCNQWSYSVRTFLLWQDRGHQVNFLRGVDRKYFRFCWSHKVSSYPSFFLFSLFWLQVSHQKMKMLYEKPELGWSVQIKCTSWAWCSHSGDSKCYYCATSPSVYTGSWMEGHLPVTQKKKHRISFLMSLNPATTVWQSYSGWSGREQQKEAFLVERTVFSILGHSLWFEEKMNWAMDLHQTKGEERGARVQCAYFTSGWNTQTGSRNMKRNMSL